MSTLEQAAREALVALTESVDLVRTDYATDWRHGLPTRAAQLAEKKRGVDLHESAIAKLQAALDAGQAQAVAVAHMVRSFGRCQRLVVREDVAEAAAASLRDQGHHAVEVWPLYAAPPAPAVPTDSERQRARQLVEDWHEGVPAARQFAWACKAAGSLLLLSAAPPTPAVQPAENVHPALASVYDTDSALSWDGFNVCGDAKSIAEVNRLVYRVSALQEYLSEMGQVAVAIRVPAPAAAIAKEAE